MKKVLLESPSFFYFLCRFSNHLVCLLKIIFLLFVANYSAFFLTVQNINFFAHSQDSCSTYAFAAKLFFLNVERPLQVENLYNYFQTWVPEIYSAFDLEEIHEMGFELVSCNLQSTVCPAMLKTGSPTYVFLIFC